MALSLSPSRISGIVIVAVLTGLLATQYLVALAPAAVNDRTTACRSLKPAPRSPVLNRFPAPAPMFSAQDHAGEMTSLAAYRGKVVFVNFWQTKCAPCIEEMPGMEKLQARFGADLAVLALASDPTWQPVREFFPTGTQMTVLLDPPAGKDALVGPVARRYGTEKWPETYLIDRWGQVRYYFINQRDWGSEAAARCIESLLEET